MLQSDTGWRDRGEGAVNDCAKRVISRRQQNAVSAEPSITA